jgi:hypothetical protein
VILWDEEPDYGLNNLFTEHFNDDLVKHDTSKEFFVPHMRHSQHGETALARRSEPGKPYWWQSEREDFPGRYADGYPIEHEW